ncbi:MAG TPA: protein adenylyltransferase SelO family protein, partial [Sphingomicrobium sp.]
MRIPFDNSYAQLPERFFAPARPLPSPSPALIQVNEQLASELSLDAAWLRSAAGLEMLSGRVIAEGSEPIAQAYAGHQFGNFVPQLGDGRAILLGEIVDRSGLRRDIQLKGAGRTRFSRGGDGRAALGPVLREYLLSEAMAALGVPTTRALAAVTTGEPVARETVLPGAMLTRVASSHIRVGTFQYFAVRGDVEAVRLLADHVIARHYPSAGETQRPYRALLD